MAADSQTDVSGLAAPRPIEGVFGELSKAFSLARESLSNFLELASLEARRAGLALLWMVVSGLVAGTFIVTAWVGLMAALAMYAVSLGLIPVVAVIVVAAVNLIAGAGMLYWCVVVSRNLLFPATRRQLTGSSTARPSA